MDERYTEMCNDNRFELIKKYKDKLIEATNIETDKAEMAVIDSVLFRFWQMGWLDILEENGAIKEKRRIENERKDSDNTRLVS